jgi:hypothetical protein
MTTSVQAQEVVKPINLATEKGVTALKNIIGQSDDFYEKHCDLRAYLKSLTKSPLRFNNIPLYTSNDSVVAVKGRVLYAQPKSPDESSNAHLKDIVNEVPCGVIITDCDKRLVANEGWRLLALLNADDSSGYDSEEYHSLVSDFYQTEMPLVSFLCLGHFYGGKTVYDGREKAMKSLDNGTLKLLDYTSDTYIDLNAQEKKELIKSGGEKKLKPPRPGFSLLGARWHRSGNCLFHDMKKNWYLIFGQDEGSYFGCELPMAVKTVDEALDALMPEAAKGVPFLRQGEWFAVEVKEKDVPKMADCVLQFGTPDSRCESPVFLPLDTPDSNHHWVYTTDGRVGRDGRVYVKDATLYHEEHADMQLKSGWWTFHRNTAITSYSQKGVD